MRRLIAVLEIAAIVCSLLLAKRTNGQGSLTNRSIVIHRTASKVVIDGDLNEPAWQVSAVADSFINK